MRSILRKPTPVDVLAGRPSEAYQTARGDIERACALLDGAERALTATFGQQCWLEGVGRVGQDRVLDRIHREAWRRLVDRMGVRSFMSVAAAKQLDEQLRTGELPDLTEEGIVTMTRGFEAQAEDMLTDAVQEAFEALRPRPSRGRVYRRNSELEVPRKVILPGVVEDAWYGRRRPKGSPVALRVHCHWQQTLVAIENVLHALQGKGSITKTHHSELSNAIDLSPVGETSLFRYKAHLNGTLHLEFKDIDLLARFNQRAGGARLRPAAAAAAAE